MEILELGCYWDQADDNE